MRLPVDIDARRTGSGGAPRRGRRGGVASASLSRILALAALLAQASGLAHVVLIPHVTCFEHGDRVHATAAAAPATSFSADVPRAGLAPGAVDADETGDDRCLLDDDGDQAPASSATSEPVSSGAPASAPRLVRVPPSAGRAPRYRLAPKNSPPA